MARLTCLLFALCIVLPVPARAAAPTRAASLYALPADGAWVEYDWTMSGPDGKDVKGTLRLSAVGGTTVKGTAYRWVEIRKKYTQGGETKHEYRKLLIAEKAFGASPTLRDHVLEVIGQDGSAKPLILSAARAKDFINMGLAGADTSLKEVQAREEVSTPLGKCEARHVTARGKAGGRTREYHGWLVADVPFGCARFEVREGKGDDPVKTVFTATAVRTGKGATGEVDEEKAR
jgi:hypothetical protein